MFKKIISITVCLTLFAGQIVFAREESVIGKLIDILSLFERSVSRAMGGAGL